ncbi:hypothetical protein D3C87_2165280 [compost metagenome]
MRADQVALQLFDFRIRDAHRRESTKARVHAIHDFATGDALFDIVARLLHVGFTYR